MKKLLSLLLLVAILILVACSDNSVDTNDTFDMSEIQFTILDAFYATHQDTESLIEFADVVITGTVVGISFTVLDATTGFEFTDETDSENRWLHTVYDIEIITTHKGDFYDTAQLAILGGLEGERVEEQIALMQEANVWSLTENSIPVKGNMPEINIGETYLFALAHKLSQYGNTLLTNLDPPQSIFRLENPFAKQTLHADVLIEDPDFFNEETSSDGDPIISAFDVISSFGEEAWSDFWEDWQDDNPDWETRIDYEAVEELLETLE